MKLTYFNYYFTGTDGVKYAIDIHEYLYSYASFRENENASVLYNSIITDNGDNVYLIHIRDRVYMFLVTKDSEIIKTISTRDFEAEAIEEKLTDDEKISFASYIYIGESFYGIASTLYGPKNAFFKFFMNSITKYLPIQLIFHDKIIENPKTLEDLEQFEYVGATSIEIDHTNSVFDSFKALFNGGDDIDRMVISVKPARTKSIKDTVISMSSVFTPESPGLKKFIFKGKETLTDNLNEFALLGTNHLFDIIEKQKNDSTIARSIIDKISTNRQIDLLGDHYEERPEQYNRDYNIRAHSNSNHWDNVVLLIQRNV